MLRIIINGRAYQLGSPLPEEVSNLSIIIQNVRIQNNQVPHIKKWLNDLVDACTCEHVFYNNTYVLVSDLKKFDL